MKTLPKIASLFITLGLLGCGGSSSIGPEAIAEMPEPSTQLQNSGAEGKPINAIGPITAFGSVIVNGVKYNTDNAVITINGQPALQDELAVGQVVNIVGTINSDGVTGVATQVNYYSNLVGPIESINAEMRTFVVLGQTISIAIDGIASPSRSLLLRDLSTGDVVEVSGTATGKDQISASFVQSHEQIEHLVIVGEVTALNEQAQTFVIGDMAIDYSAVESVNIAGGELANGVLVRATSKTSGDVFHATTLEVLSIAAAPVKGEQASIFGIITQYTSVDEFFVNGINAALSESVTYINGDETNLVELSQLNVEGEFDESGTLLISKIEFPKYPDASVAGVISSIDDGNTTIEVVGYSITLADDAVVVDYSTEKPVEIAISELTAGDFVGVIGFQSDQGIEAIHVIRDRKQDFSQIIGIVSDVTIDTLTVLNSNVRISNSTVFITREDGPISREAFLNDVTNKTVMVLGEWNTPNIDASIIQEAYDFSPVNSHSSGTPTGDNSASSTAISGTTSTGGQKNETTIKQFDLTNFSTVSIAAPFAVTINQGESFGVEIEVDTHSLNYADVTQDGEQLNLTFESPNGANLSTTTLRATIIMPSLTRLDVSSPASITVAGYQQDALAINSSQVGQVVLKNTTIGKLSAELLGVSTLKAGANVSASELVATLDGTSSVLFGDSAPIFLVDLILNAVSNATVNTAHEATITGKATNVSSLRYYGSGTVIEFSTDNSSSIEFLGATKNQ